MILSSTACSHLFIIYEMASFTMERNEPKRGSKAIIGPLAITQNGIESNKTSYNKITT